MPLKLDTVERDTAIVILVEGEVDLNSSPELRTAILKAPSKASVVAVDLSAVAYMDSSGVATLVEGLKNAGQNNGAFVLLSPSPPVMKVLQLSRLDSVFDIRASL